MNNTLRAAPMALTIAAGLLLAVLGLRMLPVVHGLLQRSAPISIELADAPAGPTPFARVRDWLRLHAASIASAERRFRIDRRAIAGVIAWEAITDIEPSYYAGFAKFAGPGKVHYKETRLGFGVTAAFQVEQMGILPKQSFMGRLRTLETPDGAITYIAAIMHAYDLESREASHQSVNCNVPLLMTLYSAYTPRQMRLRFRSIRSLTSSDHDNAAGKWGREKAGYLTEAVGPAAVDVCERK
jgi:hypothetical protein